MQITEVVEKERVAREEAVTWRKLPLAVLLAAIAAAAVNALVYLAATALGWIPRSVLIPSANGESPLTVGMVVFMSVGGAVGAAMTFALIGLFARRSVRLFRIVAAIVLVLSFVTPLTIAGAPVSMVLSMEAMHVAAWLVIVTLLTSLAAERHDQPPVHGISPDHA